MQYCTFCGLVFQILLGWCKKVAYSFYYINEAPGLQTETSGVDLGVDVLICLEDSFRHYREGNQPALLKQAILHFNG